MLPLRRRLRAVQEHGEKGKVVVQKEPGEKAVPPSQCVAESTVEGLVVPQLPHFQLVPVGAHIAEHQASGAMAVMQKEMACCLRTRRSHRTASRSPSANPATPTAALTPEESRKAAQRK